MSTTATARAPRGHPLLGHIPALRRDALGFFLHCAREWGDLVPLRFGRRPGLLVSGPAAIEEVLVVGVKNFIKSPAYQTMREAMGNGLLVNEGESWLRQRRMIQPAFHREAVAALAGGITAHADRLLAGWAGSGSRRK
jgi:cytochrome P450